MTDEQLDLMEQQCDLALATKRIITEIRQLRRQDLARSNTLGRIAVILFDDKNNVTDDQCVEELKKVRWAGHLMFEACKLFHQWTSTNTGTGKALLQQACDAVCNAFDAVEECSSYDAGTPAGVPQ